MTQQWHERRLWKERRFLFLDQIIIADFDINTHTHFHFVLDRKPLHFWELVYTWQYFNNRQTSTAASTNTYCLRYHSVCLSIVHPSNLRHFSFFTASTFLFSFFPFLLFISFSHFALSSRRFDGWCTRCQQSAGRSHRFFFFYYNCQQSVTKWNGDVFVYREKQKIKTC